MPLPEILKTKPTRFRANPARGVESQDAVDPTGGDNGAGIIRGAAIVTRGEAISHGYWLDATFLKQVANGINTGKGGNKAGVKMRFTHPSLSGDGLGKYLGRAKNAVIDGDVVRADLHFSETAHEAPDGDLAAYVMKLADDDPGAFGTSIVYDPDYGAEDKFEAQHEDEKGRFSSPDPDNTDDLIHARVHQLLGADVVDEPAANPDGLFHREQEIAQEADALFAYAAGLSSQAPTTVHLGLDADRVSGFVNRFLERHGLEISKRSAGNSDGDTPSVPPSGEERSLMTTDNKVTMSQADFDAALAKTRDDAIAVAVKGHADALSTAAKETETKVTEATAAATTLAATTHAVTQAKALSAQKDKLFGQVADILNRCQLGEQDLEFAAGMIERKLSVEEVKDELITTLAKARKPVGDGGGSDLGEKPDSDAVFGKKFDAAGGQKELGITRDEFIASCKITAAGGAIE